MKVAHGTTLLELTQEEKQLLIHLVGTISGPFQVAGPIEGKPEWELVITHKFAEQAEAARVRRFVNDLFSSLTRTEAL